MQLESIRAFFDASPAIRLLKADHSVFVLDFLIQTFKATGSAGKNTYSHDDLLTRLTVYQEELWQHDADKLVGPADRYLLSWSDAGWLSRFLQAGSPQPAYHLTQFAEDAIRFVDSCLSRQGRMVGTESRLRLVIDTLDDLVQGASRDPDLRLQRLKAERDELDRQISFIEAGGPVSVYKPAQVRERFNTAIDLLKTLQGDFRAVEDRFYAIAQQVHLDSHTESRKRGEILEYALDSEDLLKEQDEGISFYAFVSFLFAPNAQTKLRETIDEVIRLEAISADFQGIEHLRGMVPSLLGEAEKVLRTTGRLSTTLRRLLDVETAVQRRRVAGVLREIQAAAARLKSDSVDLDDATVIEPGFDVETSPAIDSPLSRELWKAPQTFNATQPTAHIIDLNKVEEAGRKMARFRRLDYAQMRRTIELATRESTCVTMAELVRKHPPKAGVMELVGLLQVAREDGHVIDRSATEKMVLRTRSAEHGEVELSVIAPLVTFMRSSDGLRRKRPR